VRPARIVAVLAAVALFSAPAVHTAWNWHAPKQRPAAVGGHHVENGTLLVRFTLEDYVPAERAWTFAHDDGRATMQVRDDAGAWLTRAATSGGEGALRVVGFGPVEPAAVAVRVVHNGVASSPRLVENYG
jgi:hypothetical protein